MDRIIFIRDIPKGKIRNSLFVHARKYSITEQITMFTRSSNVLLETLNLSVFFSGKTNGINNKSILPDVNLFSPASAYKS